MNKKNLKIAFFIDVHMDEIGGIPTSVKAQKKYLEKAGHRVVVFCPGPRHLKKRISDDGTVVMVPVLPINIEGFQFADFPNKVEKYILEIFPNFGEEFDIVHVQQEVSCGVTGVLMARRFNLPLVHTMHGRDDVAIAANLPFGTKHVASELFIKLQSRYIDNELVDIKKDDYLAPNKIRANLWRVMVSHVNTGDMVLTPSKHLLNKLKHYGVNKPIEALSNGIIDELVNQDKIKLRKLKKGETLKILWSSRVSKEKRILPFLESLKRLKHQNYCLTIIGDGNQTKMVEKMILDENLKGKVEFLGRRTHEEVMEKVYDSHLLILNSYGFDVQGMILLEAQTCGLPVIYCDPDMKEVAPSGGGFFVKSSEIEAMTEALDEILENPKLIEEKSQVMMEHKDEYLQSKLIEKLIKIYQDLVTIKQKQKSEELIR